MSTCYRTAKRSSISNHCSRLSSSKSNEANNTQESVSTHATDADPHNATSNGTANASPIDNLSGHVSHTASNTPSSNTSNNHPAIRGDNTQPSVFGTTHNAAPTGSNVLGTSEHSALSSGNNVHSSGSSHGLDQHVSSTGLAGSNTQHGTHGTHNQTTAHGISDVSGTSTQRPSTAHGVPGASITNNSTHSNTLTGPGPSRIDFPTNTNSQPSNASHGLTRDDDVARQTSQGLPGGTHNAGLPSGDTDTHSAPHTNAPARGNAVDTDSATHTIRDPHANKENYDAIPEAGGLKVGSGPFEHDRSYEPVGSGHSHGHHGITTNHSAVPSQAQATHSAGRNKVPHAQTHAQSQHATGLGHNQTRTGLDNSQSDLTGGSIGNQTLHSSTSRTQQDGVGHNGASHTELGNDHSRLSGNSTVQQPLHPAHTTAPHHPDSISHNGGIASGKHTQSTALSAGTPNEYSQSMAQHQADQMMR